MKTIALFTTLLFLISGNLFAQQELLELTFTAQDVGQYVHLDSILIENYTQGGDTTLYDPDTVLLIDIPTGIDDRSDRSGGIYISQNYPNPMMGRTSFSVFLPVAGAVYLTISDLTGRTLLNYSAKVQRGRHSFVFNPGHENFYLLNARSGDKAKTIKMINNPFQGAGKLRCSLEYKGKKDFKPQYKIPANKSDFVFSPGDLLIYTAFSDTNVRKISDRPAIDRIYAFQFSGIPCKDIPFVSDYNGNVYNTVEIGTQCWMKENLKTSTYKNGESIPYVSDTSWTNLSHGAYVWYDNNNNWSYAYGALYNWYAVVDSNGLCPEGWEVPTDDEWEVLEFYSPGGEYLKSCRQSGYSNGMCNAMSHPRWETDNDHHGIDDYGFSGLPGGARFADGAYQHLGYYSYWWSSSEWYTGEAGIFYYLYYVSNALNSWNYAKENGFSVRCIKVFNESD